MSEDLNIADFLDAVARLRKDARETPRVLRIHPEDFKILESCVGQYAPITQLTAEERTFVGVDLVIDIHAERLSHRRKEESASATDDNERSRTWTIQPE